LPERPIPLATSAAVERTSNDVVIGVMVCSVHGAVARSQSPLDLTPTVCRRVRAAGGRRDRSTAFSTERASSDSA
jgi:hypothetical protein